MRLDAKTIADLGLTLLDRDGFDALSLGKIAAALDVQTPALYWHFTNRAELFGLMAEIMMRECLDGMDGAATPQAWLKEFGRALRASHLKRRDAAKLAALAAPSEAMRTELLARILEALTARGMNTEAAFQAQSAVQSFTLGWSLFQANQPVAALLRESMDSSAAFENGLSALAEGFCNAEPKAKPASAKRQQTRARGES